MATQTRQINNQKYNVEELVDSALAQADNLPLDTAAARAALARLGHRSPDDALVAKYARESAILKSLAHQTGAAFENQIGKIRFGNREQTIEDVDAYLWRRVHGQRRNYSQKYGRR